MPEKVAMAEATTDIIFVYAKAIIHVVP